MAQKELGKQGVLYLLATPIGNLKDISLRALEILREVDLIAAEDTRNSIKLLNHFGISKPLTSYHEYNKYDKAEELAARLKQGETIALVTDAGTPGISDPGEELVRVCMREGIRVSPIPGACAMVSALSASGRPSRRFVFEGFLPNDKKEREEVIEELRQETRTIIIYEAPHHLKKTLKELYEGLGERKLTLCRELTKIHEEFLPVTFGEALQYYEDKEPRGEYVLVIEGMDKKEQLKNRALQYSKMPLRAHMEYYEAMGYNKKECMKLVAKDRQVTKREIYNDLLKEEEE